VHYFRAVTTGHLKHVQYMLYAHSPRPADEAHVPPSNMAPKVMGDSCILTLRTRYSMALLLLAAAADAAFDVRIAVPVFCVGANFRVVIVGATLKAVIACHGQINTAAGSVGSGWCRIRADDCICRA
jgi:hypothetical protein